MIIFIIIIGVILLSGSYFYSSVFSRCSLMNSNTNSTNNQRYIYNQAKIKLCADFNILPESHTIAIFYVGYSNTDLCKLKEFYLEKNISAIILFANGSMKSEGKFKRSEKTLVSDLKLWLDYIKNMLGPNYKIILHGFSDTALSVFICSNEPNIKCIIVDNVHLFPVWIYKNVKSKFLQRIIKKRSRVELPKTDVPILICTQKELSKDAYKIYEFCDSEKMLYEYINFNFNEFIEKIENLFKRIKQPEG